MNEAFCFTTTLLVIRVVVGGLEESRINDPDTIIATVTLKSWLDHSKEKGIVLQDDSNVKGKILVLSMSSLFGTLTWRCCNTTS